MKLSIMHIHYSGNSSVGRAQPCQGWGRELESRFPLQNLKSLKFNLGFFYACNLSVLKIIHLNVKLSWCSAHNFDKNMLKLFIFICD